MCYGKTVSKMKNEIYALCFLILLSSVNAALTGQFRITSGTSEVGGNNGIDGRFSIKQSFSGSLISIANVSVSPGTPGGGGVASETPTNKTVFEPMIPVSESFMQLIFVLFIVSIFVLLGIYANKNKRLERVKASINKLFIIAAKKRKQKK